MMKTELNDICSNILENKDSYDKVKYPIYILSKGRAGRAFTYDRVKDIGATIFVEPQEYNEYVEHYGAEVIHQLPKNNQGIVYVRNYIKSYSIKNGDDFHWQMDDNIINFRLRLNNKNVKYEANYCLAMVENIMDQYDNIGASGLSHTMFAFAKSNEVDVNKQVYSCILVKNNINVDWRDDCVEDTDFSLQILSKKMCTLLFNRILIEKEATKVGNGGNENTDDFRMKRSLGLQKKWPGWFKIKEEYGRVKIAPSRIWKTFNQVPHKAGEPNPFDMFT